MLSFRLAVEEDYDDFFEMKSDYNNVAWGGFLQKPDYDKFKIWFIQQINSKSNREIFIVKKENVSVGYFNLDNIDEVTSEISYGVVSEFTGLGIGTFIVRNASTILDKKIVAWVADDNIPSIKCFEKNSFVKTEETQIRNLPLLGGEHIFYKWVK